MPFTLPTSLSLTLTLTLTPTPTPPQGMLTLVSNCIDRLSVYNSAAHFSECAGEEAGEAWKDILNLLYELLGKELLAPTQVCAHP